MATLPHDKEYLSVTYSQDQIVDELASGVVAEWPLTSDMSQILLREMLPEMCACLVLERENAGNISAFIASPSEAFPTTDVTETSAWQAFVLAVDAGALDMKDVEKLANHSATFDAISQMKEASDEFDGSIVTFVAFGFEAAVEEMYPKPLLARIKSLFGV